MCAWVTGVPGNLGVPGRAWVCAIDGLTDLIKSKRALASLGPLSCAVVHCNLEWHGRCSGKIRPRPA